MLLWPLSYTFRYLGFSVLKPQLIHGVHGYFEGSEKISLEKRLAQKIDRQNTVVEQFDTQPLLQFNADTDFDVDGKLKPVSTSVSSFIRHTEST